MKTFDINDDLSTAVIGDCIKIKNKKYKVCLYDEENVCDSCKLKNTRECIQFPCMKNKVHVSKNPEINYLGLATLILLILSVGWFISLFFMDSNLIQKINAGTFIITLFFQYLIVKLL